MPLPDASVDVVISNCVINLSADKPAVLREVAPRPAPRRPLRRLRRDRRRRHGRGDARRHGAMDRLHRRRAHARRVRAGAGRRGARGRRDHARPTASTSTRSRPSSAHASPDGLPRGSAALAAASRTRASDRTVAARARTASARRRWRASMGTAQMQGVLWGRRRRGLGRADRAGADPVLRGRARRHRRSAAGRGSWTPAAAPDWRSHSPGAGRHGHRAGCLVRAARDRTRARCPTPTCAKATSRSCPSRMTASTPSRPSTPCNTRATRPPRSARSGGLPYQAPLSRSSPGGRPSSARCGRPGRHRLVAPAASARRRGPVRACRSRSAREPHRERRTRGGARDRRPDRLYARRCRDRRAGAPVVGPGTTRHRDRRPRADARCPRSGLRGGAHAKTDR